MELRDWVLLFTSTMSIVAGAAVTAVLPAISDQFSDIDQVELLTKMVLSLGSLGVVIGAPISGFITDKLGRRKLLLWSILLYIISGTSGLYLNSFYLILVSRFILGLATSGIMTTGTTLIGDYYEGMRREQMMGYSGAFIALGGIFSVSIGGWLSEYSWRLPFGIYLVYIFLLIGVYIIINDVPIPDEDIQTNVEINYPIKVMLISYSFIFLFQLTFYTIPTQLPYHMASMLGSTRSIIGIAIALSNVASFISSTYFSSLIKRIGYSRLFLLSFSTQGLGYIVLYYAHVLGLIVLGLILVGFGLGVSVPLVNTWMVDRIPLITRGKIIGGSVMIYFLARFVSPLLAEPVLYLGYQNVYLFASIPLLLVSLGFIMIISQEITRN
ncbi:MAG: MFS transporter [Candidatus Heimdallarchaeota archaeon]|nr:MFS transporter [Candidatus Heimdallarchaeota archaeon]